MLKLNKIEFAQSLPKKEKKPGIYKTPTGKFLDDGHIIIDALQKSKNKPEETEQVPPPPPPPSEDQKPERVNILTFGGKTTNYDELFGDCVGE